MKPRFVNRWLFLFIGLVLGLSIAVGMEWTRESHSQPLPQVQQPARTESNAVATDLSIVEQMSNVFASVAERVNPSVVTISTETKVSVNRGPFTQSPFEQFFGNDFFNQFFNNPPQQRDFKRQGLGSGVVVSADGMILTNNHVVDKADNIKVRLMDGREFEAKVTGTDAQTDLAVIKIDAKDLPAIRMGNSDAVRVGEFVLAVGSPLDPRLEHTVTSGIVSAKGRSGVGLSQYEDYIQTDAAINPGNSGGALVNMKGELIGINAAIVTQSGGFMGIGFAIPVNLAQKVSQDLLEKGKVVRGWLGVYIQNITTELANALKMSTSTGVLVSKVQKDSPAEKAGLQEEDIIVELNNQKIDNSVELSTRIASTSPNSEIELGILRDGKRMKVKVKLGELTPETQVSTANEMSYDKIGLTVANITRDLARNYRLSEKQTGVIVKEIDPQGVAADIGVREGDIIYKVNRQNVGSVAEFDGILKSIKPGDNVLLNLRRGEMNLFVAFTMPE